jgi:hypothetical protein
MPAFRLLRVGVKLFIRPLVLGCYQENPVFLSEKRLGSHRSELQIHDTPLTIYSSHTPDTAQSQDRSIN